MAPEIDVLGPKGVALDPEFAPDFRSQGLGGAANSPNVRLNLHCRDNLACAL